MLGKIPLEAREAERESVLVSAVARGEGWLCV